MKKVRRKIGKYEVGRTIGEGTFAKVKFARNSETGDSVAIKIMAKTTILQHRMVEQVHLFLFCSSLKVTNSCFNYKYILYRLYESCFVWCSYKF